MGTPRRLRFVTNLEDDGFTHTVTLPVALPTTSYQVLAFQADNTETPFFYISSKTTTNFVVKTASSWTGNTTFEVYWDA